MNNTKIQIMPLFHVLSFYTIDIVWHMERFYGKRSQIDQYIQKIKKQGFQDQKILFNSTYQLRIYEFINEDFEQTLILKAMWHHQKNKIKLHKGCILPKKLLCYFCKTQLHQPIHCRKKTAHKDLFPYVRNAIYPEKNFKFKDNRCVRNSQNDEEDKFLYINRYCSKNIFYVGITQRRRIQERQRQHKEITKISSAWTKIFKDHVKIHLEKVDNIFHEDRITKQLMVQFGFNRVRGGNFCQITLPSRYLQLLLQEIYYATERCFFCCEKEEHKDLFACFTLCENVDQYQKRYLMETKTFIPLCSLCGAEGHISQNCFFHDIDENTIRRFRKYSRCFCCLQTNHLTFNCKKPATKQSLRFLIEGKNSYFQCFKRFKKNIIDSQQSIQKRKRNNLLSVLTQYSGQEKPESQNSKISQQLKEISQPLPKIISEKLENYVVYIIELQSLKDVKEQNLYVGSCKQGQLQKEIDIIKENKNSDKWLDLFPYKAQQKNIYLYKVNKFYVDVVIKQKIQNMQFKNVQTDDTYKVKGKAINNVRGGIYKDIFLSLAKYEILIKSIYHSKLKTYCILCGNFHYEDKPGVNISIYQQRILCQNNSQRQFQLPFCEKCGVFGHLQEYCFQKKLTTDQGRRLQKLVQCENCNQNHFNSQCKSKCKYCSENGEANVHTSHYLNCVKYLKTQKIRKVT